MTTLNMQEQFDNVFSNVSIVFFWLGSNEIERFLDIKDRFGNLSYWNERDNLIDRIFDVLDQLVRAGKLVYVLALPLRLFFNYQFNNHFRVADTGRQLRQCRRTYRSK